MMRSEGGKLIVFDVEGVLIPKNRFVFELGRRLGVFRLLKVLFIGFLYGIRVLRLKSALRRIFIMARGMREDELLEFAGKVPVLPGVKETIDALKLDGFKIAIISSGLPGIVVSRLAQEIGVDYAFGFEVGLDDGVLNGEIWGDVIERDGKYRVLSRILSDEAVGFVDCVVVGDDRNNVPMFRVGTLRIGYNPDFVVRVKADAVVSGRFGGILDVVKGQASKRVLPSVNDVVREAIHLSAISIPLLVVLLGLGGVLLLIAVVVVLYAVSELARLDGKSLPFFSRITSLAASQSELYEFAAAPIYFAVGIVLALVLFPVPVSSAAIAMFAVGDSGASLVGRFSRMKLPVNKGKSVGGSVAGFLFAFLAGAVFMSPWRALAGALVAMIIEALPLPVNDNILIPPFAALAMTYVV